MSNFNMRLQLENDFNPKLFKKWEIAMQKELSKTKQNNSILAVTHNLGIVDVTLRNWNDSKEKAIVFLAGTVLWMSKHKTRLLVMDSSEIS